MSQMWYYYLRREIEKNQGNIAYLFKTHHFKHTRQVNPKKN